jgi:cell division protein FtsL
MANDKIKVVLHPGKPVLKILVLVMVVLCIAALLILTLAIVEARQEVEELRRQAAALQQDNKELLQDINDLGSIQSILKIALEKLGLVPADTVIIEPNH